MPKNTPGTKRARGSGAPRAGKSPVNGRFLPGNRFWEARSSHGPNPKFASADDLWSACCEYFDWVEANPLYEDRLISFKGRTVHEPAARMRAMTIGGLCMFLDIHHDTWREWRQARPDLSAILARAEAVIYRQKFEGAAADLLNQSIIARDLGLADRRDHGGTLSITIDGRDAELL